MVRALVVDTSVYLFLLNDFYSYIILSVRLLCSMGMVQQSATLAIFNDGS